MTYPSPVSYGNTGIILLRRLTCQQLGLRVTTEQMLVNILLFTLIGSVVSLGGGMALIWKKFLSASFNLKLVSLAAGVLLATSFFEILPESFATTSTPPFFPILAGIVLVFLLERTLIWHHHHHHAHGAKPTVFLITVGDGIHNFIDGVAIAASFLLDYRLGVVTSLAVMTHEIPQEIADFSVLLAGGLSKIQAVGLNLLTALTAIVGALVTYITAGSVAIPTPHILAFTGGIFIYIACSDLIPELHADTKESRALSHVVPFFLGIALVYLNGRILDSVLGH